MIWWIGDHGVADIAYEVDETHGENYNAEDETDALCALACGRPCCRCRCCADRSVEIRPPARARRHSGVGRCAWGVEAVRAENGDGEVAGGWIGRIDCCRQ